MSESYRYNDKVVPIVAIDFCTTSSKLIKNISVFDKNGNGVVVFDLHSNNEPKKDGLIDKKMGVTNSEFICETCGLKTNECEGHSGHIKMGQPIYNMGFFEQLKKYLKCVCQYCCKLIVDLENNEKYKGKKGKKLIAELIELRKKPHNCWNCNSPLGSIKPSGKGAGTALQTSGKFGKKTDSIGIYYDFKKPNDSNATNKPTADASKEIDERFFFNSKKIFNICKNISNEDHINLGLDPTKGRLENLMIEDLYVPPVPLRPSIRSDFMSSSKSSEDHITSRLLDIVKNNNILLKKTETTNLIDQNSRAFQDHVDNLQIYVASYFDKDASYLPKFEQKGIQLKSMAERLKGKEGRIRTNLMGKRTEFSARTVITPDPTISINEIGLPIAIAKTITVPEMVTPQNIEYLQKLVDNGKNTYPGVNYIMPISKDGKYKQQIYVEWSNKTSNILKVGDIVERHLQTGDIGLTNRQPSLHKGSAMAHRVRIIDNPNYSTIRLNPAVVHPYNADFDGDEMNVFFPQSIQCIIELDEISNVKYQIITAQTSTPTIGIIWDGINGGYMITRDSQMLDWRTAMNILTNTKSYGLENMEKNKIYKGRDIYSKIIPDRINLYKENDGKPLINIVNGEIIEGVITNASIGYGSKNNLIQTVLNEYDPDAAIDFINSSVRLTDNFNLFHGFTASLGDLIAPKDLRDKIYQDNQTNLLEIQHEITEYENNYNMLDEKLFEKVAYQKMSITRENGGKIILNRMPADHNLKIMINAGSKFKLTSVGEISACIGQVDYGNKRAPKTFNNRNLPFFHQNDDTGLARGFVGNGLAKGLNCPEFYFLHHHAREGLIDTSLKTADTGYMQRRLIKACEDSMVKYDGTVRNASNRIQQFIYGDSGIDTIKQTNYSIKYVLMNNDAVRNSYMLNDEELSKCKNFTKSQNEDFYKQIIAMRDHLRQTQLKATNMTPTITHNYMVPAHLSMIFTNVKNNTDLKGDTLYDPQYIFDKIHYIIRPNVTLLYAMSEDDMNNTSSIKYCDEQIAKTVFKYALFDLLNPKHCIKNKLSVKQIDTICEQIIKSFNKTVVEAGEMVGIIAAQSIGEPLTQMTLNSFHSSGGGKGTSNMGMSRIKEIFGLSPNLKDPEMIIAIDKRYNTNRDYANKIASYLKYTTIKDLRKNITTFYNDEPYKKGSFMDVDNVHNIYQLSESKKVNLEQMPWITRIEFDREKMFQKEITLLDIKSKLFSQLNKSSNQFKSIKREKRGIFDKISQFVIISNTDNDDIPIIHIRYDINNVNSEIITDFMTYYIDDFNLKGIENIEDVFIEEVRTVHFTENGDIENKNEFIIRTSGINVDAIKNINGIDLKNTYINDVIQHYENYGVEATRNLIIAELTRIISDSVNFQHFSIFADLMTNIGTLVSIDRHGIAKLDTEPLARASFEKTIEHMQNAAINNEIDNMRSVSSQIMGGLCIKGGTGLSRLIIDKDMLENSELTNDLGKTFNKTYNDIVLSNAVHDVNTNVFIPDF